MIKKGIFGGTFDPIHNGHMHIAYEAMEQLELDEVIFLPSGMPPHKQDISITDPYIRYEMVKMAIRGEKRFRVSPIEIESKKVNYTYKTLEKIKSIDKGSKLYFITGIDCLMELDAWKEVEKIFLNCSMVVFMRRGYDLKDVIKKKEEIEKKYDAHIIYLNSSILDISSSNIRDAIKKGRDVSSYLPQNVCYAIKEWGLYI